MRHCGFARVRLFFWAVGLICLLPVVAAAQAVTTRTTAIEVFDPFNLSGNGPVGTSIDPGTLACPGSQPTGNPLEPCPPASPIHLRGVSGKSRMISESPLLTGWFDWELNANFDDSGAGVAWGTFRLALDAGGVWEGSWTDERIKLENVWAGRGRFVGRGTSGSVDGMQLRFTEAAITFTLLPLAWAGPVDAEILAPPIR